MVRYILIVGAVLTVAGLFSCSPVVYDSPLDAESIHHDEIVKLEAQGLKPFDDDDQDSIPNIIDPDWPPNSIVEGNPPVITFLGADTVTIQKDDPYGRLQQYRDVSNTNLIKAIDPEGSPVTITVSNDNVNQFVITADKAPYEITYRARDTLGNSSYKTRYFIVAIDPGTDTIPPVLTIGEPVAYLSLNEAYVEQGYTAYDLEDGKPTPVTIESNNVDVSKAGTYYIVYTTSDSHGNTAKATRTVIVSGDIFNDTTPPVITLLGADSIFLLEGQSIDDFKSSFVDPGYKAWDNVDSDITDEVKPSPVTSAGGTYYYISYDVSDSHGNSAETIRRIIMPWGNIEKYAPTITLVLGDSIIQHHANTAWKDPGFFVNDVQDGKIPNSAVTVDSSELIANIGTLGTYTITYSVFNSLGLEGTAERKVQVIRSGTDHDAPVITLLGKNPDTVLYKGTYTDPGFTAFDEWEQKDYTNSVSVTNSVNTSHLGSYTILYTAVDQSTNRRNVSRTVVVVKDTLTTDLTKRYSVENFDSLPSISGKYTSFEIDNIDGTPPDLANSILTRVEWTWINEPNNKQFQFYMAYSAPPNFTTLSSVPHDFTTSPPQMTLTGSSISGLDGKYYVVIDDENNLVWVRTDGSFAIILKK